MIYSFSFIIHLLFILRKRTCLSRVVALSRTIALGGRQAFYPHSLHIMIKLSKVIFFKKKANVYMYALCSSPWFVNILVQM